MAFSRIFFRVLRGEIRVESGCGSKSSELHVGANYEDTWTDGKGRSRASIWQGRVGSERTRSSLCHPISRVVAIERPIFFAWPAVRPKKKVSNAKVKPSNLANSVPSIERTWSRGKRAHSIVTRCLRPTVPPFVDDYSRSIDRQRMGEIVSGIVDDKYRNGAVND